MSDILGGEVQPTSSAGNNWYNTAATAGGTEGAISGALGNAGLNYGNGGSSASFAGLPGYTGQINPTNQGSLAMANNQWASGNPSLSYLDSASNMSQNPFANSAGINNFATDMNGIQQYGGIGGAPTTNESLAAQYGGQSGPGTTAMSNLMQFGTASAGMTGMNNIAQYGTTGSSGNALSALANSPGQSAAAGALSPYGGSGAQAAGMNMLSGNTAGAGNLQTIAAGGGAGGNISQLPAWNAMVQAEQQPIAQGQAALQSQFDVGDNRFSTAFGQAAGNYAAQTAATQNAALTNAATASMQQGLQNQLTASGQLGSQGYSGAAALYGGGLSSAQQLAGLSGSSASQLASQGYGANNTLNSNMLNGSNNLFSGQQQATSALFNNQNSSLGTMMNYGLGQQNLGVNAANSLGSQYNNNLQTGGALGQQSYTDTQSELNNQYQQWLYTQPQNNPFVNTMTGLASQFISPTYPSYQPSALGSLLGGAGSLIGGVSKLIP